jgi:hypothetical protein
MAVGDTIGVPTSVDAGNYLDIQPGAGVEWDVHNIYYADAVAVEQYNGSISSVFYTDTGAGFLGRFCFHCTNTVRIRVKNNGSGAQIIGYDGVITK